jgi:hypothetical protein
VHINTGAKHGIPPGQTSPIYTERVARRFIPSSFHFGFVPFALSIRCSQVDSRELSRKYSRNWYGPIPLSWRSHVDGCP